MDVIQVSQGVPDGYRKNEEIRMNSGIDPKLSTT
jgi:hypothetical protein